MGVGLKTIKTTKIMKYRIKKETKPTLATFGKYKAVACHYQTVETEQILKEVCQNNPISEGTVLPGVTRDSMIHLLRDWGYNVREEHLSVTDLMKAGHDGTGSSKIPHAEKTRMIRVLPDRR